MSAGDQIGQEFYWSRGRPIGRIHNGNVILFDKAPTDYKSYLRSEIRKKEAELKELKSELTNP